MRWLHCSDFHTGKDRTAQERLVTKIIEHVKQQVSKGFIPDIVFITGDIANMGLKGEYTNFRQGFLQPLRQILGGENWSGRILAVPGNHDVDRTKNNTFDQQPPLAGESRFFDSSQTGKSEREILAPRFKAYRQGAVADLSGDWTYKPEGAFAESITIEDVPFGVVGINTAWLSKDKHDRHKLTPGIQLVEAALERVKDCTVCFVLGHHPLNWLQEDHERRLRALFGHHRVIYLHGHMHQADGSREDGAGSDFLVLQAGAAFQARDGEPWRNGLLWGELDFTSERVRLSPRFWNPINYDWPVETGRFPEKLRIDNTDWWGYPLPIKQLEGDKVKSSDWNAPRGWEVLTLSGLESHRHDVTEEEAERFFDGAEPDWTLALCPKLPRRALVGDLAQQLVSYRGQERPLAILLTGPGGEGKSMVLRQTLVAVLELDNEAQILWHVDETRPLPIEILASLPKGSWVIATNAADLVAKSLFSVVEELRRIRRSDIKFLLCARDTDWRAAGAEKFVWSRHSDYRVETMSGLSEEDAKLIASSWVAFEEGRESLGTLEEQEKRGRALFEAAQREATISEGSLLGGVLAVRYGTGLRAHVARLMDRLGKSRLESGSSLYDAFVYIAVMHAEGLTFLSRPVLAKALNCDFRQFGQLIVVPLAKEAAASGGTVMLTRHRRIAEAAVAIMVEEYGEDIGDRLVNMVRAAKMARLEGMYVPELHRWDYELPGHFVDKSPEAAVRIALALFEADPGESKLAVNLARIYRGVDEPARGFETLANFIGEIDDNRAFWGEWGVCAGQATKHALTAVLCGWALSDQAAAPPPNTHDARLSLASLGVAFDNLYEQYLDIRFNTGRSAVAHLGLHLTLDLNSHYFQKHKNESESKGASTTSPAEALSQLRAALTAAWEVSGKPELVLRNIFPDIMTFAGLARLFAH